MSLAATVMYLVAKERKKTLKTKTDANAHLTVTIKPDRSS